MEKGIRLDQIDDWGWTPVSPTLYNANIAAVDTIPTVADLTATIKQNIPLRYKIGGTYYYGVAKTIIPASITSMGAPLTVGANTLQELSYGKPEFVTQLEIYAMGGYGDAVRNNVLEVKGKTRSYYKLPAGYVVNFAAQHITDAGTSQPKINLRVNGVNVSTNDSGNGVVVASGSPTYNPNVAVDTAAYRVVPGNLVEVACTLASNPAADAKNLTMSVMLVLVP
jgi:hypothetical protein